MESYVLKPNEIDVFPIDGKTDVILRCNIKQVSRLNSENKNELCWECEEKQFRYPGKLSVAEIQADPDKWWSYTPAAPKPPRDLETRVTDLEEAVDMIVNEVVV